MRSWCVVVFAVVMFSVCFAAFDASVKREITGAVEAAYGAISAETCADICNYAHENPWDDGGYAHATWAVLVYCECADEVSDRN